jgi:tetratricopeptide (TPR) repeat protein
MKNAAYADAARHYLLAAEQYKADPISRQRAAHALFAAGNYSRASELLDRAFDLQPKLIYRDYRPSKEFPSDQAYLDLLASLRQAAESKASPNECWALLGYLHFAEGRLAEAADALGKAPRDPDGLKFVARLRQLTSQEATGR